MADDRFEKVRKAALGLREGAPLEAYGWLTPEELERALEIAGRGKVERGER